MMNKDNNNKTKKKALIIAPDFPYNTPKALRMRAFTRLLYEIGYESVVICYHYRPSVEYDKELLGVKKIIPIKPTPEGRNKYLLPIVINKILRETIVEEKPSFILSCALPEIMQAILKEAKDHRLPVILECCEWYDKSTFKHGRWDIHYLSHCIAWDHFYTKVDGVIAISKMIEERYLRLGIPTIRIPSIVEPDTTRYRLSDSDYEKKGVKLLFAGSLARTKDSIRQFVEALELCDRSCKIDFEIAGVEEAEVRDHIGNRLFDKYKCQIHVLGRIHQSLINEKYMECDYGIFFRPHKRSSEAGFSTKIAEGMAAGTPFIINDTGDIPLYIKSNDNGFIVDNVKEIAETYNTICQMDSNKSKSMRKKARLTAETVFNYKSYKLEFNHFLDGIIGRKSNV